MFGLVGLWLRVVFEVEEFVGSGLEWCWCGGSGEGVVAGADADFVAAEGGEVGEEVGEVVGGVAVGGELGVGFGVCGW